MAKLFDTIRELISQERYLFSDHAMERLRDRRIKRWQVIVGTEEGTLLLERPNDRPNPVVEVRITLPDGTDCKAVWSLVREVNSAKLVTVHFFDR